MTQPPYGDDAQPQPAPRPGDIASSQPTWAMPTQPAGEAPTQPGWAPPAMPTQPAGEAPTQPGWAPPEPHMQSSDAPPAWAVPTQPAGGPPTWAPPPSPPAQPRRRRGLVITLIALVAALLLCAGGGTAAWFLLRDADGPGAQSPSVAVNDFLVAVYSDGDVARASQLVCRESRRRADLEQKVEQLRRYRDDHKNPKFSWSEPTVSDEQPARAQVAVTVRVTTDDEQVAEEALRFTVVKKTGWFVCEVQTG